MPLKLVSRKPKKLFVAKLLLFVGMVVALAGVSLGAYQYMTNRANAEHIAHEIDRANRGLPSSMPSTIKPDNNTFANYHVAPDVPRYIYIPKVSVKALVKPMNTKDNAIESPSNVHEAGWYAGSAKPGLAGAMVIDGHAANWAAKSVFHDLKELRQGDVITVERGDGKRFDYKVAKVQSYPVDTVDMRAVMNPIDPAKPGLNLITCDGKVVKGNEFDRRLVVFAVQM